MSRELLSEIARNNTMDLVTKMGDDLKGELRSILSDNLAKGGGMRDAAKAMAENVEGMSKGRAATIARTETSRAKNLGRAQKASEKGFQSYTIESVGTACDLCVEFYENMVFSIDDVENLPPLHPNCLCVAVFHPETPEQYAAENGYDVYSGSTSDTGTGIEQEIQDVMDVLSILPEDMLTGVLEQVSPQVPVASELTSSNLTTSMLDYIDDPIAFTTKNPDKVGVVEALIQQMIINKGITSGGG